MSFQWIFVVAIMMQVQLDIHDFLYSFNHQDVSHGTEPKLPTWQFSAVHGLPNTVILCWPLFTNMNHLSIWYLTSLYNVASGKCCSLLDLCTYIFVMLWIWFLICLSILDGLDTSFYTFEFAWWIGLDVFSTFQRLSCQHFIGALVL